MSDVPNDPLYPKQWYLHNTGQSGGTPGIDLDMGGVWQDYTGKGVSVGVFDSGINFDHPDLAANVDPAISISAQPYGNGEPLVLGDTHGDSVAGIIAGVADNGIGIAGVAPNATLGSVYLDFNDPAQSNDYARGYQLAESSYDIANNSWGPKGGFLSFTNPQAPDDEAGGAAMANAAAYGRGGLGTVIASAAGNDRQDGDNADINNLANAPFVISVAAIGQNGKVANYSTPGACNLVGAPSLNIFYAPLDADVDLVHEILDENNQPADPAAAPGPDSGANPVNQNQLGAGDGDGKTPAGEESQGPQAQTIAPAPGPVENPGPGVPESSDYLAQSGAAALSQTPIAPTAVPPYEEIGRDGGIVTTTIPGQGLTETGAPGGDYDYGFGGTSAATPMVSGVIADMLQANPDLGYRDVADILALTARNTDASANWTINAASNWNGGGMHVNNDVGYGLVDAHAAVRLAETWVTPPKDAANLDVDSGEATVDSHLPAGSTSGIVSKIDITAPESVEDAQVSLNLSDAQASDVKIMLTSPSGTTSTLLDSETNQPFPAGPFSLSSTQFLGENATGTWTLQILAKQDEVDPVVLNNWQLNLYGSPPQTPQPYVYTDEYGYYAKQNPSRTVLDDPSGDTIINVSALTGPATINDNPGAVCSIEGAPLTISAGTRVAAVYAGDANTTLIGNGLGDTLFGGRGNDTLVSHPGSDILDGGDGVNTAVFANPAIDYQLVDNDGTDQVVGPEGAYTVRNIQNLTFSDWTMPVTPTTFAPPAGEEADGFLASAFLGAFSGSLTPDAQAASENEALLAEETSEQQPATTALAPSSWASLLGGGTSLSPGLTSQAGAATAGVADAALSTANRNPLLAGYATS